MPEQTDLVTRLYFGRDDAERDLAEGLLSAPADTAPAAGRHSVPQPVQGPRGRPRSPPDQCAGRQPSENEFHIHPCFRVALQAIEASDIDDFRARADVEMAQGVQIGASNVLFNTSFGQDIAYVTDRDPYLLDILANSCERILRLLSRSDMPAETRAQVRKQLGKILDSTARQRDPRTRGAGALTGADHVIQAADYLSTLATQLRQSGMADNDGGANLTRLLQTESSRLIRVVGGAGPEFRS